MSWFFKMQCCVVSFMFMVLPPGGRLIPKIITCVFKKNPKKTQFPGLWFSVNIAQTKYFLLLIPRHNQQQLCFESVKEQDSDRMKASMLDLFKHLQCDVKAAFTPGCM